MALKRIEDRQLSPTVLACLHQTEGMKLPAGTRYTNRLVADYELELFTDSRGGKMVIDHETYEVNKGDVIFKRPGAASQGVLPYTCYLICFDMLGTAGRDPNSYYFLDDKPVQPQYANGLLDAIPVICRPGSYEKYESLFSRVHAAFAGSDPHAGVLLRSYMLQILYQLYADLAETGNDTVIPSSAHYAELKRICGYIDAHLQEKLDLAHLARIAGRSPAYFQKLFKRTMGESPQQYVTRKRLDAAKEKLSRTELPIADIALACGYDDTPYFSYSFKKHLGLSPGQFRKRRKYE
ncbi:MAG: helix-turn-helix transcriptional regulator [Paenibacillaceae bacterium]|nr:helix-turn-helix transcriptional regulator [Paenibacillaceae bacterium]